MMRTGAAASTGAFACSLSGSRPGDNVLQRTPILPVRRPAVRQRQRPLRTQALAAMPVIAEVAKRALAASAGASAVGGNGATLTYMMHHQTLMFFSLLGTLGVSLGAWTIALARLVWQQWGESAVFAESGAQEKKSLYGVDVTGSGFLLRPSVMAAADFASEAHEGQMRRTGDPYIVHCIETACIVEGLLSVSEYAEDDERSELSIIAALLHDVVDDTRVDLAEVEANFGAKVARLVGTVTQLSQMNQLMRRKQRRAREEGSADASKPAAVVEENELRNLILTMVDEPLAILIKLADRLHNMRTVYALAPAKAHAVALETQRIWCSLAERLGMFALKSELEDLCFAVLQPLDFRRLRHDLDVLWGSGAKSRSALPPVDISRKAQPIQLSGNAAVDAERLRRATTSAPRRLLGRAVAKSRMAWPNNPFRLDATGVEDHTSAILAASAGGADEGLFSDEEGPPASARQRSGTSRKPARMAPLSRQQQQIKSLVESIQPFDELAFKSYSRVSASNARRRDLDIIDSCGRQLLYDLQLNGEATGFDINIQGRLKSLYSIHRKMKRKGVSLEEVYDARALRVVIDDGGDRQSNSATEACYVVKNAVQRLWKPIHKEADDYIANPKGSGMYQSLHMAVVGPGGVPMEVQLRTSSMHTHAEYGAAAHWMYKEASGPLPNLPSDAVRVGQPVLRVGQDGVLADGVIMGIERDGLELLVAIARRGRLAGATGSARGSPNAYRRLAAYIECKQWSMAGQSDSNACLQSYVKCKDGAYHMKDAYGYNWPTTVVPLQDLATPQPAAGHLAAPPKRPAPAEAAAVQPSAALPLSQLAGAVPAGASSAPAPSSSPAPSSVSTDRTISEKTRVLRAVLEWGKELDQDVAGAGSQLPSSTDVMIILWPPGIFKRLPRGTTVGQIIRKEGLLQLSDRNPNGLVNVNNRLVPENTQLADGDLVLLTAEVVEI